MALNDVQAEEIPLDSPEVSISDYKEARSQGKDSVTREELEANRPPEVSGEEGMREYKEKRAEQEGHGSRKMQRRLDRLTKHNAILAEELARYKSSGNGSETTSQGQEESTPAERQPAERQSVESRGSEGEDPSRAAIRARYADFDAVMEKAISEKMRVSDSAAEVIHGSQYEDHLSYMIARSPELRAELNRLPEAEQVVKIRELEAQIDHVESGRADLVTTLRSQLGANDGREFLRNLDRNNAANVVLPMLARELLALPNIGEVVRHVASDPQTAQRIAGMSREAATVELGRISARLEGSNGPRIESHAPAPISPVGSGSTQSTVPLDKTTSMADYKRRRARGQVR